MKSAFSKGFLLKNHLLRPYYLGFDWPRWIALIKGEISHYEGNGLAGQFWQMESALSFTDKDWNLVPGILTPQRGIQNPLLSCRFLLHGGWVAFDIELRTIEDLNSRRWQINPGIFCDTIELLFVATCTLFAWKTILIFAEGGVLSNSSLNSSFSPPESE